MTDRIESTARAIYETEPLRRFPSDEVISWDELKVGAFARRGILLAQAKAILEALDAPVLALLKEAESRYGSSMYCKVTTYELRKALGIQEGGSGDE